MKNRKEENKEKSKDKVLKTGTTKNKKGVSNDSNRGAWLSLSLLLLVIAVVYFPALQNGFTNWDDDVYVYENKILLSNEGNQMEQIWTKGVAGNYHPITMMSLLVEYKMFGENPFPFHATNILFHILNSALVFAFVWLLSKKNIFISLVTAGIFGLHPLHVESVAWISERKDVLYAFFFFAGLISYIYYLDKNDWKYYFGALVLFVLSMLSKPAAVVFPVILILIEYVLGKLPDFKRLISLIPFFIISIAGGLATIHFQKESQAVGDLAAFDIGQRTMFAAYGIVNYLVQFVIPHQLSSFYPYPSFPLPVIFPVCLGIVIILAITFVFFARYSRQLAFGGLFFFVTIALVLQFISVGDAIRADRYTYIPYVGLAFVLAYFSDKYFVGTGALLSQFRKPIIGILVIWGAFLSIQTYGRTKVWKNSETLWTNVIENYPNAPLAWNNRGHYYKLKKEMNKALSDYTKAIELKPDGHLAYGNRANVYFEFNQDYLALLDYNKAIKLKSDNSKNFANRGALLGRKGETEAALNDFNYALNLDPDYLPAIKNRAVLYGMINEHEKALVDYKKHLRFKPDEDDMQNALGVTYQHLKKYPESIEAINKAIRIRPGLGAYYLNRSFSWFSMGEKGKALSDAEMAASFGTNVDSAYLSELRK